MKTSRIHAVVLAIGLIAAQATAVLAALPFAEKWTHDGIGVAPGGPFNAPKGVAVDAVGNIYIADSANNRILKLDVSAGPPWSVITITGLTAPATLNGPEALAVDLLGNIYVADTANNRVIKMDATGSVITKWTSPSNPTPLVPATFNVPGGVAVDASGNLYVADTNNNRIVKLPAGSTNWVLFASTGLTAPAGLAADLSNVYVANTGRHTIRKYDVAVPGTLVATFGTDGVSSTLDGKFNTPEDVAVDANGNIYVADKANHRVQKLDPTGALMAKWGRLTGGGLPTSGTANGEFNIPQGIAVGVDFNMLVADTGNHRIQRFGCPLTCPAALGNPGDKKAHFRVDDPTFLAAGTELEVTLYVSSTEAFEYAKFTLDYNTTCLTLPATGGTLDARITPLIAGWTLQSAANDDGTNFDIDDPTADMHVTFDVANYATPRALGCDIAVAKIRFNYTAGPTCTIRFDDAPPVGTPTNTLENIPASVAIVPPNLAFCDLEEVCEQRKVTGSVLYWKGARPIIGAYVHNATSGTPEDYSDPTYELLFPSTPLIITMDAHADHQVPADDIAITSNEISVILNHIAGGAGLITDPRALRAGDVNLDDAVNLVDLTYISQWLVFIRNGASDTGFWTFDYTAAFIEEPDNYVFALDCEEVVPITAYFLGDIDGSWPTKFPKPTLPPDVGLELALEEQQGDLVTVGLRANPKTPLGSLIFSLDYDPAVLEYQGMATGSEAAEWYTFDNAQEAGVVHAIAVGWKGAVAQPGEILKFTFRVLDASASGRISFSRLLVNDQDSGDSPELRIGDGVDGTTAALPVKYSVRSWPNPFNPQTRVEYTIPLGSGNVPVVLSIYDVSGRLVRTLEKGSRGAGMHSVVWNGMDDDGKAARTGVYMLRIRAGEWSDTEKLMLVK